jgi:uncharacterized protein YdeI (BOF family)
MRERDQVITVQGVLSLIAIAVMLGYAVHALQIVPRQTVAAYAQDQQNQQQPAGPATQQAGPDAAKTAVYTGTIVKHGSGFLLRGSSGTDYHLDDPSRAQPFAGKPVKVTGKLDKTLQVIRVEKIEETRA